MSINNFFAGNGPRVYKFERALSNCKQRGESVVEYFCKLTKMWDELANYGKALDCCYGRMTCKWIANREQQREEKRVLKFLLGSDPFFRTIICHILNMNPLPTINNAYNMIIRKERHSAIARD